MTTTGIDFVALQCRDLGTAASFYRDIVGLPTADHSPPNAVVFATTPIPFAVRRTDTDLDLPARPGAGVALWLRTQSAPRLHDHLCEHDVDIVRQLAPSPFGQTFTFADPEGYLVTVHDDA